MTSFITLVLLALASSAILAAPMDKGKGGKPDVTPTQDPPSQSSRLKASELVEMANNNANMTNIINGDIAYNQRHANADPCTSIGCKWPKSNNGLVEIPIRLSKNFSRSTKTFIKQVLKGFSDWTCISFVRPRGATDVLSIKPLSGCWSYVGRQGGEQELSLGQGCVYQQVIEHEILHALGLNHEHSRSDRDEHVDILYENIQQGREHNFEKIATNNLATPYDYGSVMQYSRNAFSKDRDLDTIVPKIPAELGGAYEMSDNDIERINVLYACDK